MQVSICHATVEGQTGKIARFVADCVSGAGHTPLMFDVGDERAHADFDDIDRVILAAPVHERRHPRGFEAFVAGRHADLADRPVLMLSVSLKAAFAEGRDEAQDYLDEMLLRTGLEPDASVLVAGAVRPESYGYFESQVLRHVVLEGQSFDPGVKHEFTDWDGLRAAVRAFLDGG